MSGEQGRPVEPALDGFEYEALVLVNVPGDGPAVVWMELDHLAKLPEGEPHG